FNQIDSNGGSFLGSGLANCTNLSNLTLNLCGNQIGVNGASDLGSAIAKCSNLSNLTLDLRIEQVPQSQKISCQQYIFMIQNK
ncbi:hypothetical protein ABPG73_004198, partial [Tetrahymena malaccensis]